MPDIHVINSNYLEFEGKRYACAVGKEGFSSHKTEGDGCTPLGRFALRSCLYRADKMKKPITSLHISPIFPDDGWCNDPAHIFYNRAVKKPFDAHHEDLWRQDDLYDLIIPLGYNDAPVVAGKGSAIFMHIAKPDYAGTEGCIALAKNDLLKLLEHSGPTTYISIHPA